MIKVIIIGQKWLAQALLQQCLNNPDVQVVAVSPPSLSDKLAILATKHKIPITLHGKTLKAGQIPLGVDVILTAHAYCFVTATARSRATFGAVGYHPSLLPAYQGKNAIVETLVNGETVTGGSLYQLDDGWDTGRVLLQREVRVNENETAFSLWKNKLAPLGLELFATYLNNVVSDTI